MIHCISIIEIAFLVTCITNQGTIINYWACFHTFKFTLTLLTTYCRNIFCKATYFEIFESWILLIEIFFESINKWILNRNNKYIIYLGDEIKRIFKKFKGIKYLFKFYILLILKSHIFSWCEKRLSILLTIF